MVERSEYHTVRALELGATEAIQPQLLHHLGITSLHQGRHAEAAETEAEAEDAAAAESTEAESDEEAENA